MASLSLPGPLLGTALAAFLGPACGPSSGVAPVGPLAVAEPRVDFGRVHEGRVLTHEWSLEARELVAVVAAKTDCGCTLAQLEREGPEGPAPYELGTPLTPGERLRVSARYDTRGRRGPSQRAVTLVLDPRASLALELAADVRPWLAVEPPDLPGARVVEGEGAQVEFRVASPGGEPFALSASGVALPPWVTLELEPEGPGPRAPRWKVRARLGEEAPRGTFSYPLELVSDVPIPGDAHSPGDADSEPRHFSVAPGWTLQVVGPVALDRPTLEFGLMGGDEVVAQSLRLESFDPAFAPMDVQVRLEPLKPGEPLPLARTARLRTHPSGSVCEIELTLDGLDPAVKGTFLARLVIETGHPALPRLEAFVRGVRTPEGSVRPESEGR